MIEIELDEGTGTTGQPVTGLVRADDPHHEVRGVRVDLAHVDRSLFSGRQGFESVDHVDLTLDYHREARFSLDLPADAQPFFQAVIGYAGWVVNAAVNVPGDQSDEQTFVPVKPASLAPLGDDELKERAMVVERAVHRHVRRRLVPRVAALVILCGLTVAAIALLMGAEGYKPTWLWAVAAIAAGPIALGYFEYRKVRTRRLRAGIVEVHPRAVHPGEVVDVLATVDRDDLVVGLEFVRLVAYDVRGDHGTNTSYREFATVKEWQPLRKGTNEVTLLLAEDATPTYSGTAMHLGWRVVVMRAQDRDRERSQWLVKKQTEPFTVLH